MSEKWINSKAMGYAVVVNDRGRVIRTVSDDGQNTLYPYRWSDKNRVWINCSGYYTPSYLNKLIMSDKAKWA